MLNFLMLESSTVTVVLQLFGHFTTILVKVKLSIHIHSRDRQSLVDY